MARRGTYDNSFNNTRTRIDMRPQNDPATQAGLRNVHRDMRGNVIGATTPEGYGIGTKSRSWQTAPSGKSRLGAPSTPGLDRLAAMQTSGPPTDFGVANEKRKRQELAASGAFGKDVQSKNFAQRRSLFKDMQAAGSGAKSPTLAERAKSLGVTGGQYDRAWNKVPAAPAMVAAPNPSTPPAGSLVMRPDPAMPAVAGAPKRRSWSM